MHFRILGTLAVADDAGAPVPLASGRARALTIRLLLARGQVVPVDDLIDDLWDGRPPASAQASLWNTVTRVRRALSLAEPDRTESRLGTHRSGYRLELDPAELDAWVFERELERGRKRLADGDLDDAARVLRGALDLWRGPALADVRYAEFAAHHAARLDELRLEALEECFEADIARGRHDDVLADLEALTLEQPLRERLWEQLMLARYRCGRQADALDAFQTARRRLVDELGIEPGSRLRTLHRAMLQQDPVLDGAGNSPNRVVARAMSEDPADRFSSAGELADAAAVALRGEHEWQALPVPASRLIGREPDIRQIRSLLEADGVRLITLTGPGGAGKTHLALAAARHASGLFEAGARAALLAGVAEAELVLPTVATALGVRAEPGRPLLQSIALELDGSSVLLVLDNLEHLLDAAPLVGDLLAQAPSLKVLATSRAPLRLAGEREYAVPPLPEAAAVELFIDRARAVQGEFPADAQTVAVIGEITAHLDRLPLAIELAAARTRVLPPAALLERLDRRFELLVGGRRDQPERQRTLRATITWSYDLLSQEARTLLTRLAVFAGGFSLDLATAVAGGDPDDVVDELAVLLENSLARAVGSIADEPRYLLLESVRAFGLERLEALGEGLTVRDRHAEVMVDVMERAARGLAAGHQVDWLDRLDAELDNLRAAVAWIQATGSGVLALRMAAASRWYGLVHGRWSELRGWAEHALTYGPMDMPALYTQALVAAINLAQWDGDGERAEVLGRELLAFAERHADPHGRAHALNCLGIAATGHGDYARASTLMEEALPLCRDVDDQRLLSAVLNNLGDAALQAGEFVAARARFEESAELARRLGRDDVVTMAETNLAASLLEIGDIGRGRDVLIGALRRADALSYPDALYAGLATLPALALAEDDTETAARLSGAVEAAFETANQRFDTFEGRRHAELLAVLQARLPQSRFDALRAEGRAMTVSDILTATLR